MTVAHSLRAGWPLDRVHPVLGVYRHYPAANYVPLMAGLGTRGFSVFLADQATAADYAALAPLAAAAPGRVRAWPRSRSRATAQFRRSR